MKLINFGFHPVGLNDRARFGAINAALRAACAGLEARTTIHESRIVILVVAVVFKGS